LKKSIEKSIENKLFKIIRINFIINTMEILDCKDIINEKINAILKAYQDVEKKHSHENNLFTEEVERLNKLNSRYSHELAEKDKLLTCKDKTIYDYENIIKGLHEKKEEEGKFDMIRGQNQEIKNLNDELLKRGSEIKKLNGKINLLEQIEQKNKSTVEMKVEEVDDLSVEKETHSIEDEKEEDESVDDLSVEKETPVIEDDKKEVEEEEEEEEEEEALSVDIITHYKKTYYIIENEVPQYIYNIDDDEELGDKVGVIEKNGKKVFDKKK